LAEQYREFVDAGAEVVTVLSDSADRAHSYFEQHGIPFSCLVDPGHQVYDLYQVERRSVSMGQRPGLFVIDSNGIVQYAHIGWQQWEIPENAGVLEVCRGIPCGVIRRPRKGASAYGKASESEAAAPYT